MCTNYRPTRSDQFARFTEFPEPRFEYPAETYKDYLAPILRLTAGEPSTDGATFAMVPRRRIPPGVKVFETMNARTETVEEKRSYSGAWKRQQLCLIPCESIFEPSYETVKPVRWRIEMASHRPFAIAGLWRAWEDPDGVSLSFTMLTLNADGHPLMKRFHRPGDEKR
ncbi:SOS response-associated peptidase family protein [Paraburkholderia sp. GAS334]|uniref:SOS response-associated peptidase family protein n=1 Tax=Paraburkholderia sp. GAS334 TaxID=3035131 RepID=UPI003D19D3B6